MNEKAPVVLVIEDDEGKRYVLQRLLKAAGMEVREASSGADGLAQAGAQPDVIVLDVMLPDLSGHEVCRRLKQTPGLAAIPVLQVSGTCRTGEDKVEGLDSGADAYLMHPYDAKELLATVRALLRVRQAEREKSELLRRAEVSERHYRLLADQIPQMVWTADAHGVPDYFNQRWFEFTGVTQEQPGEALAARRLWRSVHPEDARALKLAWRRSLAGGDPFEAKCRLRGVEGQFRWHLVRAIASLSDGQVLRWFGTATDVDEQERREQDLVDAGAFRDRLVGIVGHDLRNPLAAIAMATARLIKRGNLPEEEAKSVARVQASADRIGRILDQLLDMTRARLGDGIPVNPRPCELAPIATEVVDELRAGKPEVTFDLRIDGNTAGVWDAGRLEQAVSNLVGNAVQHGQPGGPVAILVTGEADSVSVSVHNRGEPIPADLLPSIFNPFTKGARGRKQPGSLGLGLFIVAEIVRSHRGQMEVTSTAEAGTTFTFRIPRRALTPTFTSREAQATAGPSRVS